MKYHFSEEIKTRRFNRDMYAIMEGEKIVAYSEFKFEIPDDVLFLGFDQAYIFKGAVICGGEIWGGVIRGGVIRGGVIWGGEIWGGVIRGGEIRGGVIRGGVYETTLLQIQGSRHFCYLEKTDEGGLFLCIGCHKRTIDEWKEKYQSIGESEEYTEAEIAEYYQYILMYDNLYQKK